MITIGQGTTGTKITDSEKLVWDMDVMQCGHMVERCDSYIDDDNILRMRYVCEEGHLTPWIKIKRVILPHEIDLSGDVYLPYEPETYKWNNIVIGDIITFNEKDDDIIFSSYEVAYKILRKRSLSGTVKKILYLRPVSTGENVLAELWGDGTIHFMDGMENPLTSQGYQSWTEGILLTLQERVRVFKERGMRL